MRKQNSNQYQSKALSSNPLPWSYFVVLIACGCVLAAGFFLAARQHFTSMDLGIKNSKLRRQLEDLESENRRLLLAKEVSLSPGEIKRTARNLGFKEVEMVQASVNAAVPIIKGKAATLTASAARHISISDKSPSVKMTAFQKPIKAFFPESTEKPTNSIKQNKRTDLLKDKKEITGIAKLR